MGHPVGNADPRGSTEWSLPLYVPTPRRLRKPLLKVSPYRPQEQDHSPSVNRTHGISLVCGNGGHCGRARYKARLAGAKTQQHHEQLNDSHAALEVTEAVEYGGTSLSSHHPAGLGRTGSLKLTWTACKATWEAERTTGPRKITKREPTKGKSVTDFCVKRSPEIAFHRFVARQD